MDLHFLATDASPDFIRGGGSLFHEELLPDFAQLCFKSRYGIYKTQLLLRVLSEANAQGKALPGHDTNHLHAPAVFTNGVKGPR